MYLGMTSTSTATVKANQIKIGPVRQKQAAEQKTR